jgi:HEAT repeat protein
LSIVGFGRSTALYALIEIGEADFDVLAPHTAIFFDQIDADRSSVRRAAAQGLGLIGRDDKEKTDRAIAALVDRLDDKPFVRQEACEALRAIHAAHPEPVEEALGDRADDILSEDELDLVAS